MLMRFLKGQKNMKKVKWHKIAVEHIKVVNYTSLCSMFTPLNIYPVQPFLNLFNWGILMLSAADLTGVHPVSLFKPARHKCLSR